MQTSRPAPVMDTLFAFQGSLLRRATTVAQTVAQHCMEGVGGGKTSLSALEVGKTLETLFRAKCLNLF